MTEPLRRIDHLVLAVHDLDAAGSFYQRLGFQVGARNRHPWGTENRLVQFRSSFLEIITVADAAAIPPHSAGVFSFGAFVRDYLEHREGLAMLALDSSDAVADAERFSRSGIGDFRPFSFERTGRRPDGEQVTVGFSLAFANDAGAPGAAFFVCQQHDPESFWSPLFQRHGNGATNVTGVRLDVDDPSDHVAFLGAFTGARPSGDAFADALPSGDGRRFELAEGGRIELRTSGVTGGFSGFGVGVPDLGPVEQRLTAAGMGFDARGDRLEIHPTDAFGASITFEAPST